MSGKARGARIIFVTPAYNEAANLPCVFERIAEAMGEAGRDFEVVVCDDGSRDATPALLAAATRDLPLTVVTHEANLGFGVALRDALAAAASRARDDDAIVTLDADATQDPGYAPLMVDTLARGADVVVASRYAPGAAQQGTSALRRMLSRGAGALLSLTFPTPGLKDYSSGFRAIRVGALREAARRYGDRLVEEHGFAATPELLLKLRAVGARFAEVPFTLRYDAKEGESKIRIWRTIRQYLALIWRLRTRRQGDIRMKICVVGSGYVGLVSGACFAHIGHEVTCVDSDHAKIEALKAGTVPIYEPGLEEMVQENAAAGRLSFTCSIAQGVRGAEVVFICVGTPSKPTGEANMVYVENVAAEVGRNLTDYTVIVEKSTVPVQTGEWVRKVLTRSNPHTAPFDVVSNPEFLREGSAIEDNLHPDRIVIGTDSERAVEVMRELYAPIIEKSGCPVVVTDIATAELIKHASNAFLATKISFINAVANICERTCADVRKVAEGMGYDRRIGRAFLNAGVGYGGSCFPKDVAAFTHIAFQLGYEFDLLRAVAAINDAQRDLVVNKVKDALWNLEGKRVAVWGLAFKPDTDDMRNAPALTVIERLMSEGAEVIAYDPKAMRRAAELLPTVTMAGDPYEAVTDADALVLLTEWDEFRGADLDRVKNLLRYPVVVDGRNLWDRDEMTKRGFHYVGVGV